MQTGQQFENRQLKKQKTFLQNSKRKQGSLQFLSLSIFRDQQFTAKYDRRTFSMGFPQEHLFPALPHK